MLICNHWFHACDYTAILRQKRKTLEKSKKSKRYSQKNLLYH